MRFQDFKTAAEYIAALLSINNKFELCNELVNDFEKIDKTLFTFHVDNMLLQYQYRGFKYVKFNALIDSLHGWRVK